VSLGAIHGAYTNGGVLAPGSMGYFLGGGTGAFTVSSQLTGANALTFDEYALNDNDADGSGRAPATVILTNPNDDYTDWPPFTFTMNWRFTRPGEWVRFEAMEPIASLFPVQRGAIEAFEPRFAQIEDEARSLEGFNAWSRARDDFHRRMHPATPATGSEK